MNHINNSVFSLICVSLFSAIICRIIENSSLHKAIKTVCSLSILLCIINLFSPILSILSNVTLNQSESSDKNSENSKFEDVVISQTKEYVEEYVSSMICTKFELEASSYEINVFFDGTDTQNVILSSISILFLSEPDIDVNLIADFVSSELMCKVVVLFN